MYSGGVNRANGMLAKAEASGRSVDMPYAKEIYRDYVEPLAKAIDEEVNSGKAGKRQAHAYLLMGLDLETVAYLTIRYVFGTQLSTKAENHRQLAYGIGRTIQQELLLLQVEDFAPDLYHTLVRDLGRRLSKDAKYRTTVMRMQAEKEGLIFTMWPIGAREQVGMWMLGLLETMNFICIGEEVREGYKRKACEVVLHPDIIDKIDGIKDYVSVSMPVYGPCIEPPMDWVTPNDGGFHSRALRRSNPGLVRAGPVVRELVRKVDMPIVLKAANAMQRTAWAVNTELLAKVYEIAKVFSTKEIVSLFDKPRPVAPVWLESGMKTDDMDENQQAMFKRWKRDVATWHTERKLMGTRYGRFYAATRQAEMFRHYDKLYFVYFADSRGRLYPMTYGLNPQGSDLGKSLLHFATGKPVSTPEAIRWFHVQGANKWGFDKATLAERHAWVVARQDELCSYAADPVANRGWAGASDPLQFLAWCLEYKRWCDDTDGSFVSHLPISMDGSCNGLQNLSALFRDEIGGKATNLTNNVEMEDIYRRVAEAATVRLSAMVFDDQDSERCRVLWLEHGINRKVVKRSVMTTPYGVTLLTATDYVVADYLTSEDVNHPFGTERKDLKLAARVLMKAVWPAIGDVVVKGREAMDWLKKGARRIVNSLDPNGDQLVRWDTPSGFPASQAYFEEEVHRINTRLHGPVKIRVFSETDEADIAQHASGLAPNFVHSMDAAHLHLTAAAAADQGLDLAMIHDDYGTHAADSQALFDIIRRQFVAMYDMNDPIKDLCDRYKCLPPPPTKGELNILDVLHSEFFFS